MATPAKVPKLDTLRPCPYGNKCYRKNPQHFLEFSHPSADGSNDSGSTACVAVTPVASTSDSLPPCKYGAKCYRKNLLHFAEFSHPTTGAPSAAADKADDSSSDTEVYSSEDEKEKNNKDILSRGMSLVKSFSQMTEEERKELIKKAFEAKLKLQEELELTKKQMEEKDKELSRLQDEVNKGMLLLEGESEALEGTKTVYFPLVAERDYKEGSAAQIHFRLAESQFYRLLSGTYASTYRVSKVEYVVTPFLVKRFKEAREMLKKERGEPLSYPVLAFHGTNQKNITPICETGFKTPGDSGFHHKTDSGWYGAGVYFSEYPSYSMGYISGSTKLLLCQVLPGKVYNCTTLIHGASLQHGYDSHMSPCKKEIVIFNSHHILPCYVVHYTTTNVEFKYTAKPKKSSLKDLATKCKKAFCAKATSVFSGKTFVTVGKLCKTQQQINNLIVHHKGSIGTARKFEIVVSTSDQLQSTICNTARKKTLPIVSEEFLYECILQKTFLDTGDFAQEDA